MKAKILYIFILVFSIQTLHAQVGIGTTDPKATLDIPSSNVTNPTNTDGILIPRIDDFPSTNPSADQDGMMVFVTGNSTPAKGFYYWNQATTSWVPVSGAKSINDLTDGKSDNDGSDNGSSLFLGIDAGANDDSTHNFNVGIGFQALQSNSSSWGNTAIGYQTLQANTTGMNNTATGAHSLTNNSSGVDNIAFGNATLSSNTSGSYNSALGHGSLNSNSDGNYNAALGYWSLLNNDSGGRNVALGSSSGYTNSTGSSNVFIGYQSGYFETGSEKLYIENSNSDSNNALIYGEFDNNILRTNGELQIGNPSTTGYAFPTSDGTNGQILTTDGSGNLTFQDIAGDGDTQNTLDQAYDEGGSGSGRTITVDSGPIEFIGTSGTAYTQVLSNDDAGDILNIISTGVVPEYTSTIAIELENDITTNNNNGNNYGIFNKMSVNGTRSNAKHIGFRNWFLPAGSTNSQMYGFYNESQNGGTGDHYGFYNRFHTDAGSGTMYGFYNSINSAHNNTKYGLYSAVIGTLGTNYAVYGLANNNSNSWAGFFAGRVELGHNFINRYFMPGSDGTNGQVMTTDGAGNVTFQDYLGDGNTQNTLNQAYNEGGPGAGRSIIAINGAVEINGQDGFQVVGTFASGSVIMPSGAGTRMFFNPRKAAFRAGLVAGNQWDNINVGIFSFASGQNNIASGNSSTAFGRLNNVSGIASFASGSGNTVTGADNFSVGQSNNVSGARSAAIGSANTVTGSDAMAFGIGNNAPSLSEITIGSFATTYGGSPSTYNSSDRIFSVGIGTGSTNRANALTIYKNGIININDVYDLPSSDGTNGQVLTTDGTGNTSWQNYTSPSLSLARIIMSANQTYTTTGWQKINFDTVDFDLNTDFNTTTDRFIVSDAGYYRVNASWRATSSSSTGLFAIAIYVNGTLARSKGYDHSGHGQIIRSINRILDLNANDTVEIYMYTTLGLSISSSSAQSSFTVEQIR